MSESEGAQERKLVVGGHVGDVIVDAIVCGLSLSAALCTGKANGADLRLARLLGPVGALDEDSAVVTPKLVAGLLVIVIAAQVRFDLDLALRVPAGRCRARGRRVGPGVAAACDVSAVVVGTRRSRGRGLESAYICNEYGHLRIEGSDIRMRQGGRGCLGRRGCEGGGVDAGMIGVGAVDGAEDRVERLKQVK